MRSLAALALITFLVSLGSAFAQEIPDFPGWKLDRVNQEESDGFEYSNYFSLIPPDRRPPITIDGGTAARLLNGQASPETIYLDRLAGASGNRRNDGQSGGIGGAVGWQMAESTYVPVGEERTRATASLPGIPGGSGSGFASGGSSASGGGPSSINPGGSGGSAFAGASSGSSGGAAHSSPAYGAGASAFTVAGAGGSAFSGSGGAQSGSAFGSSLGGGNANRPNSFGAAAAAPVDTSNMTYSQMIESANVQATQSLCARMGSWAQGGACR